MVIRYPVRGNEAEEKINTPPPVGVILLLFALANVIP